MIPIRDDIRPLRTPIVNYALILACLLVFLAQLGAEGGDGTLVEQFGMIPARVVHPDQPVTLQYEELVPVRGGYRVVERRRLAEEPPIPAWLTVLTCIFLHGGWLHFLGNMWFLWIFGDNVEDRLGRLGYLGFYLGCGVAASLAHLLAEPSSTMPTVGASGAIAGVMGAYLLLYPHARVLALVPLGFLLYDVVVPASWFLGLWFLMQFFQGTLSLGGVEAGGVAWWAHIGGFVVGGLAVLLLRAAGRLRPAPEPVQLPGRGPHRRAW